MDHVILNHGQVTWTTPELARPLLTITPYQRDDWARTRDKASHDLDHSTTASYIAAEDPPCRRGFCTLHQSWLKRPRVDVVWKSATLVSGYHFDMAKKRILTHDEINRHMNNSDELSELSEDGLEYSDDDVDFLPNIVSSNED
ncbi:hypothetical protein TNCV_203611 [Trichonephila clavipes]|nr:hypothetical protein TNCV_203611 [Trichonephila clavipes]